MDEKIVKDSQGLVNDLVNDTISRQAAVDIVRFECGEWGGLSKTIIKRFEDLPAAQPERKRGTWIPVTNGRGGHECSLCHSYAPSFQTGDEWLTDYCPTCGADMRGEADE